MEQSLWLIIKIKIASDFTYFSYSSTSSLTGDFSRTTEGFFEKCLRQVTGINTLFVCSQGLSLSPTRQHLQGTLVPTASNQQRPSLTPQILTFICSQHLFVNKGGHTLRIPQHLD